MKKLIVFVLIIFTAANLHAQNRRTGSLKLLLANEKTDTGKVAILIRLGFFGFGSAKNDSALWYLQQALQLAQETKYIKGELTAVLRIASYYQRTGNYPEALKMSLGNLRAIAIRLTLRPNPAPLYFFQYLKKRNDRKIKPPKIVIAVSYATFEKCGLFSEIVSVASSRICLLNIYLK